MSVQVHVVSHTHWDREWYLTFEQFRLRLLDLVDRVLDLLDQDERFTFHLDGQTVVLEDYLEIRPEQEARLRGHVSAGRLLVGPWYVMPDQFLVSGEALVRNLHRGHRIAQRFGGAMRAGYIPDPFGHVAQMPQLLRGVSLDSAILWRGFGGEHAEYVWEAPDGSRVLLLHLPEDGYCNALWLPLVAPEEMEARAASVLASERARTRVGQVLFMAGVDHVEPHPRLRDVLAWISRQPDTGGGLSTLPAYVDAVRAAAEGHALEVVRGELRGGEQYAFLLPGVLSARVYLKQANARVQRALEHWAEPLSALAWLQGAPFPRGPLDHAWRTLLRNHPHDSICGCSVDAVHDENETRYARAEQIAEELVARALAALGSRVAAGPGEAVRVLAVNTDAHAFAGVCELDVTLPVASAEEGRRVPAEHLDAPLPFVDREAPVLSVRDARGRPLAFQVLGHEAAMLHLTSRYEPPWTVHARRLRVAVPAEVAALGWSAFDVHFAAADASPAAPHPPVRAGEGWLDNGLLRVSVNANGTFDLHEAATGRVRRGCATLLDEGDVGDEYTYAPPPEDRAIDSGGARVVASRVLLSGPLRAALEVALELPVPVAVDEGRRGRRADTVALPVTLQVSLDAGRARADVVLQVDNRARDHRLRVLFPTGAREVRSARADSAFTVVERPARREVPADFRREAPVSAAPLLSFVDAGDDEAGLSAFVDGLCEYEMVEHGGDSWLALTLLRCVGFLSRDDLATRRGGAGPQIATPGAQCLGASAFRLAVAPRAAPPAASELFAAARDFLSPPRAVVATGAASAAPLPAIAATAGGLVLSACTLAADRPSLLLRVFNPGPAAATCRVALERGLSAAFALDLLERRGDRLPVEQGAAAVTVRPHAIATVELVPEGGPR